MPMLTILHTMLTAWCCYTTLICTAHSRDLKIKMTMTMTIIYLTIDIQIEIIMYNSLENQIINWSGDHY